ncbi:hypothetical protein AX769_02235 [Frondihabitans sp. PAMC 28766]|uniref:hypothetical protein n=1 Tax=Frondihabitans sp. PAMC 28766 TaxID=1795630 RepID=UPI00078DE0AB|nr:hypothetical protein [Frondihabitans sp. PAMC 28766]AMM19163.1 hypothetical protein AX769_02235 [Frondihabitans sp. PAMC 28766]
MGLSNAITETSKAAGSFAGALANQYIFDHGEINPPDAVREIAEDAVKPSTQPKRARHVAGAEAISLP